MKTLKRWLSYLKVFIKNIFERMTNLINDINDANAGVKIAKIEAGKEIIMAIGKNTKEMIIATGKGINNVIKTPFKDRKNMRITGVMIIGAGVGVGGAFIIASYIK